jgi:hypothetical protein
MKANSAFWAAQGQARLGTLLGDKWVKVPASATGSLGQFEVLTDPATIGHCMLELHLGTVTKAGTAKVAGKDAVVLAQKADRPGASPGKLYVATSGPVLPLRATQTGKQAPGATPDKTCHETPDDVKSTTSSGDLMLGDYDKAVTIEVPPGALDLERLGGGNLS